jgi:hypothetical protein
MMLVSASRLVQTNLGGCVMLAVKDPTSGPPDPVIV